MSTAVAERPTAKRTAKRSSQQLVSNRCTALTKAGKPCTRTKKAGLDVCASHAPNTKVGQTSKFTEEVKAEILKALKAGAFKKDAAAFAGVSSSVFDDWLARGQKAREAGIEDDEYAQFLAAVEITRAKHKVFLLSSVTAAAKDDWRAGLELLSRMFPNEYGRRDAKLVEHTGTVGVEALLGGRQPWKVPPHTRERIIALLEESAPIDSTAEEE